MEWVITIQPLLDTQLNLVRVCQDGPIGGSLSQNNAWPAKGAKVMEWFSQKTSIAGTQVPNWALVLGAVIIIWIIYRLFT